MPNTFIDRVNLLGKDQQEIVAFTDRKGQIIGYGDVQLTGVDWDGYENEALLKIENKNDLNYQEDQQEVHTDQEYQTIIQQVIKL